MGAGDGNDDGLGFGSDGHIAGGVGLTVHGDRNASDLGRSGVLLAAGVIVAGAIVIGQVDAGRNDGTVVDIGIVVVVFNFKMTAVGEISGGKFISCDRAILVDFKLIRFDRIT